MIVDSCRFQNNSAVLQTGAARIEGDSLNSYVSVTNCSFIENSADDYDGALKIKHSYGVTVTNNLFSRNKSPSYSALNVGMSCLLILVEHNTFFENSGLPESTGTATILAVEPSVLRKNNFIGNKNEYIIYSSSHGSAPDVDATNNYWDTTSKLVISAKVFDKSDVAAYAEVSFEPFLFNPDSECPEIE